MRSLTTLLKTRRDTITGWTEYPTVNPGIQGVHGFCIASDANSICIGGRGFYINRQQKITNSTDPTAGFSVVLSAGQHKTIFDMHYSSEKGQWVGVQLGNTGVSPTVKPIIVISTDGFTWSSRTLPIMPLRNVPETVSYGGGYWFCGTKQHHGASPHHSYFMYASDANGAWAVNPQGFGSNIQSVCYGNSLYALSKRTGSTVTDGYGGDSSSPSGYFSMVSFGTPVSGENTYLAYGGGYWMAVFSYGSIYYATHPSGPWIAGARASYKVRRVRYLNGLFFIISETQVAYTPDPLTAWKVSDYYRGGRFTDVTYFNGHYVVSNEDAKVLVSD